MSTVTIIIPVHGHEGMTRACVEAAITTLPTDLAVEVVVVDDASPEPLRALDDIDPRVRLVRSDANLGFAGACNLGASRATGELLVFLNSDTEPQPGWLAALVAAAQDPSIGIVGARLLYTHGTVQHAGVVFSQADGLPRHVYRGFPAEHPAVLKPRDLQAVTAACVLVRADVFRALDGFDDAYRNEFEDIDLCLRARAAGHRVTYCPTAVVTHLEAVSRRPEAVDQAAPPPNPNRDRFRATWGDAIVRDELAVYAADGLIRLSADDVYPLVLEVAPELAIAAPAQTGRLAELLSIRSRQVFDLISDNDALRSRLLDEGDRP